MSNPIKRPEELEPQGPEGVPVDAPDNDAPALSPLAVSRMHRAENDREAISHSVDFSDDRAVADDRISKPDKETPRGRGEGELMEQPSSTSEARQRGADTPKADE
jgi:hypothetical protein